MESSSITRRGRPRKNIRKTIKRDLDVNALNVNMIDDRTLWHHPVHLADPT